MRISARCDYACKALLELAFHWPDKEPLQIHTISENQGIPLKYLVQILIQLKRLGLVKSARGKEGGYNLAVSPNSIRLSYVVRQISGPLVQVTDSALRSADTFVEIWKETEIAIARVLDKITFEDIAERAKRLTETANYQI